MKITGQKSFAKKTHLFISLETTDLKDGEKPTKNYVILSMQDGTPKTVYSGSSREAATAKHDEIEATMSVSQKALPGSVLAAVRQARENKEAEQAKAQQLLEQQKKQREAAAQ